MKLTNPGTVPVYTVSGASTARPLPDWLARQRKRSLKNDREYQNRVELLQDFEFEEASNCIAVSEDGDWAVSAGTYKPQIHVHTLSQLCLSFTRHTESLTEKLALLSTDYSKTLLLQSDRKLELHTPMGLHYGIRIPRYGRDLAFDRPSAEVYIPSVGVDQDGFGEVFRLNMEVGRFMKSFQVDVGGDDPGAGLQGGIHAGSINTAALAENSHGLAAFGTSLGTVEFWDARSKSRVALLSTHEGGITALDFNSSGLSLATGSSNGMVQLFDLRRPVPLLSKDQGYGFPIKKLIHMTTASQEKKVLSADKRIIKIWDELDGEPFTSVEPIVDLNDVAWCKDTGMLLTANEGQQQHSFFIPSLGPAPKWCSFLDNMVEEMAEDVKTETYDNYKFLTLPELRSLSLAHLIGKTNLLRPYMHGYFVASKLYDQARLIANPYIWEEERTKRIKEKVEKERESRIRGKKKVKVNQRLADKLLERQQNREQVDTEAGMLGDNRFTSMFEDEAFKVDENSREFRSLNPNLDAAATTPGAAEQSKKPTYSAMDKPRSRQSGGPSGGTPDMTMTVSSSRGKGPKDAAFGSRAQKNVGRVSKAGVNVVGERQVTFVPEAKKKKMPQQFDAGPRDKKSGPRRSASSNTMRKL